MKTLTILSMAMLAGTTICAGQSDPDDRPTRACFSSIARYETVDLKMVQRNMLASLDSENDGVVESALAHAAYLRLVCPTFDMSDLRERVIQLASEGRTASIRYKAHLASQVCCQPAAFVSAPGETFESKEEFFMSLGSRLQAML